MLLLFGLSFPFYPTYGIIVSFYRTHVILGMLLLFGLGLSDATQGTLPDNSIGQQ